jgi:hypothetical protein
MLLYSRGNSVPLKFGTFAKFSGPNLGAENRMVAGEPKFLMQKKFSCGACNNPDWLVLPFRLKIDPAGSVACV